MFVCRSLSTADTLSLALDRVMLPCAKLICKLGNLWAHSSYQEQVAAVARRAFTKIHLVHQFQDQETLLIVTHLLFGIMKYVPHGVAFEDFPEIASDCK